jgi:DNA-directed RNA polymerase subunit F
MNEEENKKVSLAEQIANEIVSVQPMSSDLIKELYEQSMTKEELKKEGYKPVSRLGLMWVKDDE